MKNSMILTTAVAAVLASGVASAELSGNAGIFSNYIWRGITQTNDQSAGQGGIDYSAASGFYAGTWVSNVAFGSNTGGGYEMDVYAGFGGEAGDIGYDVGIISYQYPVASTTSFTELYASGTMNIVTVGLAYTIDAGSANKDAPFDSGDLYLSGSLDFPLSKSDVSIYAGTYTFSADGNTATGTANYSHFGASISKDGFSFAMDKNTVGQGDFWDTGDSSIDNVRFTVSYAVDFEL